MRTLVRLYEAVLRACAWTAAAILAAITLAIPLNILLRVGFSSALFGVFDAIEYGLLAATFLAAPWVLAQNAHVTVDLLIRGLPPRAGRRLTAFADLLGALLSLAFLYYSLLAVLQSAARGSMVYKAFAIPEWWPLALLPLSMSLLAVEFLRRLLAPRPREPRAASSL